MQIPIINGIFSNSQSDFRTAYPLNLVPVPKEQGISKGYLRPAEGIDHVITGPGTDRGGIWWNNAMYRVMGAKLVRITHDPYNISIIGDIPGTGPAKFDYSFDYLGIGADSKLWLFDGVQLQQITDPDLGTVVDFLWVDGYFMTTDGEFLVVTELNDPFSVDPLKYGSAESDPDPIKAIIKIKNEVYALNRNTVEVFQNIGGVNFPFARIAGAQVMRGTLGTRTCCQFLESIAFLGGGRNESLAIWLITSAVAAKISTREIDQILSEYDEDVLANAFMESRVDQGFRQLYLHLPDKTLVYEGAATITVEEPVWFVLSSGLSETSQYRAKYLTWAYNHWFVGDPQSSDLGILNYDNSSHWGNEVSWEFLTEIVFNNTNGAIFHELELVALTGRSEPGVESVILTSYSTDGMTWSQEQGCRVGLFGNRNRRITWLRQGMMERWRVQKFRGTSSAHTSFARLEAKIEPLAL
jgi:hypothetical protein